MAIQKQEFYEGAAIHRMVCFGGLKTISLSNHFFLCNDELLIYFKYSTRNRSPWGFTFGPDENESIADRVKKNRVFIGLICGSDGVAVIEAQELLRIGPAKTSSVRIACFRKHGEYYRISGPEGELERKIRPSDWTRLLASPSPQKEQE